MVKQSRQQVLTVIPARGGSKSVSHKNIAPAAGKPLIAWTIETALDCSVLNRVIVSTDDEEIANVARRHGAEVPFLRPAELARDETPGIEPILHAVRWLDRNEGYSPDYVMVLQPTSPLRTAEDIEAVVQLAQKKQADGVVSVCPADHHPYWMKRISEDGHLVDFLPMERSYHRRQDLPSVYASNGAIYLVRRDVIMEQETFYTDQTYGYVMPPNRSLDIDTPWDLSLARLILGKCD
jgi:N-acylneuraminate cytidylyltransferase/CMP-N,N'-diacetyllegionaminic acid synthase